MALMTLELCFRPFSFSFQRSAMPERSNFVRDLELILWEGGWRRWGKDAEMGLGKDGGFWAGAAIFCAQVKGPAELVKPASSSMSLSMQAGRTVLAFALMSFLV